MKTKRFKLLMSLLLIFGLMLGLTISKLRKGIVSADIPRVEKSKDESYDYEFSASSYKAQMRKSAGNPNLLISQNSRQMDITVFDGAVKETTIDDDKSEINQASGSANTQLPIATQSSELSITPSSSPTPTPSIEPVSSLLHEVFIPEVNAQSPESADSSEIEAVQGSNESYVYYPKKQFRIDPVLDKIALGKEVQKNHELPSIYLNLTKLSPELDQDDLLIRTRTGRKVFLFTDAKLTDANGVAKLIKIVYQNIGNEDYLINFEENTGWLDTEDRVYPVTLSLNVASLFSDKMLPFWPKVSNFKAFEPAEFDVDTAIITDEDVKKALQSDELSGLKLGTIDSTGAQKVLDAKVVSRDGDIVTIDITNPDFKPGIFDLLIQYQDNPAYIAQDDFSWGVLSINPDMAIYPQGSTAKLDMAVLDKYGEMVCDADLLLSIQTPDGKIIERSTLDGSITVSDKCLILMTDKPDYSTTIKLGNDGEYIITLSAITKDGNFVLNDSFKVDSNSSFYVKRLGPTRIYPILTYDMEFEITSATDSGTYKVVEKVPSEFVLSNNDGNIEQGEGKMTNVSWDEYFTKGQRKVISYTFDAPDVSPELFLLGPLEIKDNQGKSLYSEGRSWQIASDAIGAENTAQCTSHFANSSTCTISLTVTSANLVIVQVANLNGSQAVNTTGVSDSTDGNYTEITSASYAGTNSVEQWYLVNPSGSQTITVTLNGNDYGDAAATGFTGVDTTTPIETASSNTGNGTTSPATASITCANSGSWSVSATQVQDSGAPTAANTSLWSVGYNDTGNKHAQAGEYSNTCASPSWTLGKSATWAVSTVEVNQGTTGPTMDQLMRHGNWFSGDVEQSFYWAN